MFCWSKQVMWFCPASKGQVSAILCVMVLATQMTGSLSPGSRSLRGVFIGLALKELTVPHTVVTKEHSHLEQTWWLKVWPYRLGEWDSSGEGTYYKVIVI